MNHRGDVVNCGSVNIIWTPAQGGICPRAVPLQLLFGDDETLAEVGDLVGQFNVGAVFLTLDPPFGTRPAHEADRHQDGGDNKSLAHHFTHRSIRGRARAMTALILAAIPGALLSDRSGHAVVMRSAS